MGVGVGLSALIAVGCGGQSLDDIARGIGQARSTPQAGEALSQGKSLDDFADKAALRAFCEVATRVANSSNSPTGEQVAADIRAEMQQAGVPALAVNGPLGKLEAGINLAEVNGQAAVRYARACIAGRRG